MRRARFSLKDPKQPRNPRMKTINPRMMRTVGMLVKVLSVIERMSPYLYIVNAPIPIKARPIIWELGGKLEGRSGNGTFYEMKSSWLERGIRGE